MLHTLYFIPFQQKFPEFKNSDLNSEFLQKWALRNQKNRKHHKNGTSKEALLSSKSEVEGSKDRVLLLYPVTSAEAAKAIVNSGKCSLILVVCLAEGSTSQVEERLQMIWRIVMKL